MKWENFTDGLLFNALQLGVRVDLNDLSVGTLQSLIVFADEQMRTASGKKGNTADEEVISFSELAKRSNRVMY